MRSVPPRASDLQRDLREAAVEDTAISDPARLDLDLVQNAFVFSGQTGSHGRRRCSRYCLSTKARLRFSVQPAPRGHLKTPGNQGPQHLLGLEPGRHTPTSLPKPAQPL